MQFAPETISTVQSSSDARWRPAWLSTRQEGHKRSPEPPWTGPIVIGAERPGSSIDAWTHGSLQPGIQSSAV
jgi:hypothetical protein